MTIAEAGRFVGQNAVQLHGAMGMTRELDMARYFRRLTVIEGQIRVRSGEDEQVLGPGDTARYMADRNHAIAAEAGAARALLIVQDS